MKHPGGNPIRFCAVQKEETKTIRAYECPLRGRYVAIRINGYGVIKICEVQVYGQLIGKLCFNRLTSVDSFLT